MSTGTQKLILYKFRWLCHSGGSVQGMFVSTENEIYKHLGCDVQFGEILGKHSEVSGTLDLEDLTVISEDQDFIEKFVEVVGSSTGYNPLDYIGDYDEGDAFDRSDYNDLNSHMFPDERD